MRQLFPSRKLSAPRWADIWTRFLPVFVLLTIGSSVGLTVLGQNDQTVWRTEAGLDKGVLLTSSNYSEDYPLRKRLELLAKGHQIAIYLDRRVDSAQPVTFSVVSTTFEQMLWQLADQLDLGVCRLENVFYFGPKETTEQLPMLVAQAKKELRPSIDKRSWKRARSIGWEKLTTPREVLTAFAKREGVVWKDLEEIPYDLWPEVDLPRLSAEARLAIILVGMEKWCEPDGENRLRIIDLPDLIQGTAVIRNVPDARSQAKSLKQKYKDAIIRGTGKSITVTGSPADFTAMKRELVGKQAVAETSKFDLDTFANRGSILAAVARQAGLKFEYEPELGAVLAEKIAIDVRHATLVEVIEEVLSGTGLEYRIDAQALRIVK